MRARLLALAAATLLLLLSSPACWATIDTSQESILSQPQLPAALAEDDSFDDLPFEQLRQALREEGEQARSIKKFGSRSSKKYNLLIR